MAVNSETDQRNAALAKRIKNFIQAKKPIANKEIGDATSILDSLISRAASRLEYQARRDQLFQRLHFWENQELNLAGINVILSAAYHSLERSHDQSDFKHLPEGFKFPAFAATLMETSQGRPTHVLTASGLQPSIALTPDGYLVRFRPTYYFNERGQGLRYDGMLFTNPFDLKIDDPHDPKNNQTKLVYRSALERAGLIQLNFSLPSGKPIATNEKDLIFMDQILGQAEAWLSLKQSK